MTRMAILQEVLQKGLQQVSKTVPARAVMPVLYNVRLQGMAGSPEIGLTAADTGRGIFTRSILSARVDSDFDITLPFESLSDLVGVYSPDRIDMGLNVDTQTVTLRCGGTKNTLKGINSEEFPEFPPAGTQLFVIAAAEYIAALDAVEFCAAREETRPILAGVCHELRGGMLTLVAADSLRVGRCTVPVQRSHTDATFVIPISVLQAARSALAATIWRDEENLLSVGQMGDMITFKLNNIDIGVVTVEGVYPDWRSVINFDPTLSVGVYPADFWRAIGVCGAFAPSAEHEISCYIQLHDHEPSTMLVRSVDAGRGDAEHTVIVPPYQRGQDLTVGLSIRHIRDLIGWALDQVELFEMRVRSHDKGVIFVPHDMGRPQPDVLYMLMPIVRN